MTSARERLGVRPRSRKTGYSDFGAIELLTDARSGVGALAPRAENGRRARMNMTARDCNMPPRACTYLVVVISVTPLLLIQAKIGLQESMYKEHSSAVCK